VTPIRTATNTAGKAIRVGRFPVAIAITPNSKTAYVVNHGNFTGSPSPGTVTPMRTAANKALRAIKVGNGPVAIAITP
jgi:DNA-binding beta-propeller fold protein YncE